MCRQPITGGDVFGTVYENELITDHKIMCPPNIYGTVVKVSWQLNFYTCLLRGRGESWVGGRHGKRVFVCGVAKTSPLLTGRPVGKTTWVRSRLNERGITLEENNDATAVVVAWACCDVR